MNKGMDDADRVKLSYEDLGRPQVDQALTAIKKQKKRAAVGANAGAKDLRTRAIKRFVLLALAGLLSLALVLSLLYFGKSWISGQLGQQEKGISDPSKSPLPGKAKRI